jgi:hypothetical protein
MKIFAAKKPLRSGLHELDPKIAIQCVALAEHPMAKANQSRESVLG